MFAEELVCDIRQEDTIDDISKGNTTVAFNNGTANTHNRPMDCGEVQPHIRNIYQRRVVIHFCDIVLLSNSISTFFRIKRNHRQVSSISRDIS